MRLIVGLGNPGIQYAQTRHNVGWDVLDLVARGLDAGRPAVKFGGQCWGPLAWQGCRLWLFKPLTYMNNSGVAVGELVRFYRMEPQKVLAVYDDVALPLGRLRLRPQGSAGGHNGVKSLIAHLGTQDFPRLRVGVGAPDRGDMVNHVLGRFAPADRPLAERTIAQAAQFCLDWCRIDMDRLMNKVNGYRAQALNGEA